MEEARGRAAVEHRAGLAVSTMESLIGMVLVKKTHTVCIYPLVMTNIAIEIGHL